MRRYYFDLVENGDSKLDDKGLLLVSEAAAKDRATGTMAILARHAILEGRNVNYLMEVRDDHGVVCRIGVGCFTSVP